jgi:hypothetical protein
MSIAQILQLLRFCLSTTYFVFQEKFYKQKHGTAMVSPVSPIVANLYMEVFETKALNTAIVKPKAWYRYVDDTFVVIHEYEIERFTNHINNIDPNIKFTSEPCIDNKLAFLDTLEHIQDDGSIKTTVYHKPTHKDQYLNFKSNHHLTHKRSVVHSLSHRANTIVTTEDYKLTEIQHVQSALLANNFAPWALNTPKAKIQTKNHNTTRGENLQTHSRLTLCP